MQGETSNEPSGMYEQPKLTHLQSVTTISVDDMTGTKSEYTQSVLSLEKTNSKGYGHSPKAQPQPQQWNSDANQTPDPDSTPDNDEAAKQKKTFLFLKLNDGVSSLNVFALMLAYFGVITLLALQIDFMSFLLDDNFNIVDDEAARVMGNIGFTGTVASIMFGLVLGTLMDIVGRKIPTVAGLFVTGIFTSIIPVPKHIAWLYLFRCINNIATMPLT